MSVLLDSFVLNNCIVIGKFIDGGENERYVTTLVFTMICFKVLKNVRI